MKKIAFDPQKTAATIEALKQLASKKTRLIVSMPLHQVILHNFTLELTLSNKEIITFLQSQSRLLFEKTENELCFDYEVKSRDQTHQTISAVFAHQKEIQCTKKLFSQSKLKLTVIDIDAFALARLTHYSLNKHIFIYSDYDENCLIVIATAGKLMHCEYIKPASINHFLENSKEKYDYITPLPEAQNKSNYGDFSHKLLSIRSLLYPWFINKCAISSNQLSCFAIPIGLCLWEKHEH